MSEPATSSTSARRSIVVVARVGLLSKPTVPASAAGESAELCGLGRYTRAQLQAEGMVDRLVRTPLRHALEEVAVRLAAAPDDRRRAAAVMVRAWANEQAALREAPQHEGRADSASAPGACGPPPCEPASQSAARESVLKVDDAIARIAVETRDPWVYGLAVRHCIGSRAAEQSHCQLISAPRWTQIEPDNATAWFYAADAARERRHPQAFEEAVYRAAHAPRNDIHLGRLAAIVANELPQDTAPFVALTVEGMAVGAEAATVMPGPSIAARHCTDKALRDPNRRQTCDALAHLLVERSSSMLELATGRRLGQRLAWPEERLVEIDRQVAGMQAASRAVMSGGGNDPFGCRAVKSSRAYFRSLAELGELEALRHSVAAASAAAPER